MALIAGICWQINIDNRLMRTTNCRVAFMEITARFDRLHESHRISSDLGEDSQSALIGIVEKIVSKDE